MFVNAGTFDNATPTMSVPLKKSTQYGWNERRSGRGRSDLCWVQHDAFAFAKDFETGSEVGESPMPILGHCFLMDCVNESRWNRAIVPPLNDIIAKSPFLGGSGK